MALGQGGVLGQAYGAGFRHWQILVSKKQLPQFHTREERTLVCALSSSTDISILRPPPSHAAELRTICRFFPGNKLSPGILSNESSMTDLGLSWGQRLLSQHEGSDALRVAYGAGLAAE